MPQVVIEINEQTYTMECGAGQEEHVRHLARRIDKELAGIRAAAGPVGEIRLLIMTALVMADRMTELEERLESLEQELARKSAAGGSNSQETRALLDALGKATEKLQRLAQA